MRRAVQLWEVVAGVVIVAVLASVTLPWVFRSQQRSCCRAKCSNMVKGIGIGAILYSNDHRFYPHMTALDQESSPEQVSAAFRTLLHLKYVDTAEVFICPQSEERFVHPTMEVLDDPKRFVWSVKSGNDSGLESGNPLPISAASTEPAVLKNGQLSYTWRRRKLNASTASERDRLLADKEIRGEGSSPAPGSHEDGVNLGYADGRAVFEPTAEDVSGLVAELVYGGSRLEALAAQLEAQARESK